MTKSSNSTKTTPHSPFGVGSTMVLPATKPRNPFGVGSNMGKAGSHQKSNKAQRQQDNKATKDIANQPSYSGSDFAP